MKDYELTYIISPDLSEQEIKSLSDKVSSFIKEEQGTIKKTTEPSKRKLGYPIKEKQEGFLVSSDFSLSPEQLSNLERKLKTENQILRYIIVIKEKIKETPPRIRTKPITAQPMVNKPKDEKVELKEIDKKIEEILKE